MFCVGGLWVIYLWMFLGRKPGVTSRVLNHFQPMQIPILYWLRLLVAFLRWWWWWWWWWWLCLAKTFGMGWNHQPDWLACLQISMVALISPIVSDNERTYDILRLTCGHVCWKNPRPKVTQQSQGLYTAMWSIIAPMPHYIPVTIPMDIM